MTEILFTFPLHLQLTVGIDSEQGNLECQVNISDPFYVLMFYNGLLQSAFQPQD